MLTRKGTQNDQIIMLKFTWCEVGKGTQNDQIIMLKFTWCEVGKGTDHPWPNHSLLKYYFMLS